MAIFSNQATLTYNGNTTSSNIAYGELIEVLSAAKTTIEGSYQPGEVVTYAVTLRNTGTTALTGLTVNDDLGGYVFDQTTVYPLTYVDGSARIFYDGVLQPAPAVTAGPPLTITGISVPAEGNTLVLYQARANEFANPAADGTIVNTAAVTGAGLSAAVQASVTLPASAEAALTIAKAINPAQVTDNDRVTYTFLIQNTGAEAVTVADNAVITDIFDPILTDLTVTFNDTAWTAGTNYTYNQATGLFTTNAGQIVVPAATYTQDAATGAYTVTPGVATLTVTGTI